MDTNTLIKIAFFVLTGLAWIYFLVQFIKERKMYKFIVLVWVPIAWLSYVFTNPTLLQVLNVVQMVLFVLLIIGLLKKPKEPEETEEEFNATNDNENIVELPEEEYEIEGEAVAEQEDEEPQENEVSYDQENEQDKENG